MDNYLNNSKIPMGLGMALAQNVNAMKAFTNMSEAQQQAVLEHTHQIASKSEMRSFVEDIANGKF